jgi:hypothetical protein
MNFINNQVPEHNKSQLASQYSYGDSAYPIVSALKTLIDVLMEKHEDGSWRRKSTTNPMIRNHRRVLSMTQFWYEDVIEDTFFDTFMTFQSSDERKVFRSYAVLMSALDSFGVLGVGRSVLSWFMLSAYGDSIYEKANKYSVDELALYFDMLNWFVNDEWLSMRAKYFTRELFV